MIAIIPARGGSKGLPNKNIKLLNGRPLIAWTIDSALKSKIIKEVIVSTDDNQIADIAKLYDAEVPFLRPKALASDNALAIDVYNHAIDFINKKKKSKLDSIIILLPTCPMRDEFDIDSAFNLFRKNKADSVISYTKENHPINWHKYLDENNKFIDIFDENKIKNRQSSRVSYYPNGAIYIFKTQMLKRGSYYSNSSYAYIMAKNKSIDIDTIEDFQYAEFLMKKKQR